MSITSGRPSTCKAVLVYDEYLLLHSPKPVPTLVPLHGDPLASLQQLKDAASPGSCLVAASLLGTSSSPQRAPSPVPTFPNSCFLNLLISSKPEYPTRLNLSAACSDHIVHQLQAVTMYGPLLLTGTLDLVFIISCPFLPALPSLYAVCGWGARRRWRRRTRGRQYLLLGSSLPP